MKSLQEQLFENKLSQIKEEYDKKVSDAENVVKIHEANNEFLRKKISALEYREANREVIISQLRLDNIEIKKRCLELDSEVRIFLWLFISTVIALVLLTLWMLIK